MTADLVVRGRVLMGGEVVDTSVTVAAGRITALGERSGPAREEVVLADGEVLIPGLVDTHVHVNEPGRTEWEGFRTATRAAAAGGVTTIVDMPLNSLPPTIDVAALEVKRAAAAGQVHVDVGFWGGAVPSSLGSLAALHDEGVLGFKCFLVDSGVPEFPPLSWTQLDRALAETAALGALMVVHAEDPEVLTAAPACAGAAYDAFVASRPDTAEEAAVSGLLLHARQRDARVHVLHLSSAAAAARIARAKQAGIRVPAETCPHYLTHDGGDGRTDHNCCPPVRVGADREALWRALADGTVDCVVSDPSPAPPDLKRLDTGDFGEAWGGIASLQLGLPVVWTAARERGVDLVDVVRWMGTAPADLVGLPGKGRIEVGAAADLVVLAPDASFTVDPAGLEHRHPVTPYAGRELFGQVRTVWLGGRRVVERGRPVGEPAGLLLRRETR